MSVMDTSWLFVYEAGNIRYGDVTFLHAQASQDPQNFRFSDNYHFSCLIPCLIMILQSPRFGGIKHRCKNRVEQKCSDRIKRISSNGRQVSGKQKKLPLFPREGFFFRVLHKRTKHTGYPGQLLDWDSIIIRYFSLRNISLVLFRMLPYIPCYRSSMVSHYKLPCNLPKECQLPFHIPGRLPFLRETAGFPCS